MAPSGVELFAKTACVGRRRRDEQYLPRSLFNSVLSWFAFASIRLSLLDEMHKATGDRFLNRFLIQPTERLGEKRFDFQEWEPPAVPKAARVGGEATLVLPQSLPYLFAIRPGRGSSSAHRPVGTPLRFGRHIEADCGQGYVPPRPLRKLRSFDFGSFYGMALGGSNAGRVAAEILHELRGPYSAYRSAQYRH